jgi:hypothetical protein
MAENDFVFAKWAWQAKDVGEVTFDKGKIQLNGDGWSCADQCGLI